MSTVRRSRRLHAHSCDQINDVEPRSGSKRRNRSEELRDVVQPEAKKCRLTESNLRRHQRQQNPVKMVRRRKTPSATSVSKTSTATDKWFASRLAENRVVYLPFRTIAPDDIEKIKNELSQERPAPDKATKILERIRVNTEETTYSELSLESVVVESLLHAHDYDAPSLYSRYRNDQWTGVDNEFTAGISNPKPNVIETYAWKAFHPDAREEFGYLNVSQYNYTMPTFAMESKGPSGSIQQAVRQAAYDGAVMTHAALAFDIQMNRDTQRRFGKTKAVTVTLSDTTITVYANHAVMKKTLAGEEISYHQYKIVAVNYLDSEAEWLQAHSIVYNAQNLALRLATSRIKAVELYFRRKNEKQAHLKVQQTELQKQAREKTQQKIEGDAMSDTKVDEDKTTQPSVPAVPPSPDPTIDRKPVAKSILN